MSEYKRSELIDIDKESRLISSVLELAFEPNSKGWKVNKKNLSIQIKRHPTTKRPIYRITAKNTSSATIQQIYDYYEAGYKRKNTQCIILKQDDHIMHHIDADHDIIYWKGEGFGPIATRDLQYMAVRFKIMKYKAWSGIEYNVVGSVGYDIQPQHPLYTDPPKNGIREKKECYAYIYYQRINAADNDFVFLKIDFTKHAGGWVPNWFEDIENAMMFEDEINNFSDLCTNVAMILRLKKENVNNKQKDANHSVSAIKQEERVEMKNNESDIIDHPHVIDTNKGFIPIRKKSNNMLDDEKYNDDDHAALDHPNIVDTNKGYELDPLIYNQLIAMGFDHMQSTKATDLAPNDINQAINIAVHYNEDKVEMEYKQQSANKKQFTKFLKRINMEKYLRKFEENECCDMESIEYFDDDFLQNTIGINNKILRKKCLAQCKKLKDDINKFKNEYGITDLLCDRLAKYGIVTLNILCEEIKSKNDIKYKYEITNDNQCTFLWDLIQNIENEMQIEGH